MVEGGPGDDILCGGRSADKLFGGPGDDLIYGEEENDTIFPGAGDDRVLGSAGDDRIFGYGEQGGEIIDDGIDLLNGGYNDDIIVAGGADTLLGYTHDDTLSTTTPPIAPALMDGGGNDDVIYGSEAADNIRGGERLSGDDKLYGAGGNDKILGDGNDDELYGQLGDDELLGGDGFDLLDGGPGTDVCDGGDLVDTAPRLRARDCDRALTRPRRAAGAGLLGPVATLDRTAGSSRSRTRIRSPPSGDRVGIWRIVIVRPGRRSKRSRCSAMVATSFTSVWPKRLPMQIREPPPKGT